MRINSVDGTRVVHTVTVRLGKRDVFKIFGAVLLAEFISHFPMAKSRFDAVARRAAEEKSSLVNIVRENHDDETS